MNSIKLFRLLGVNVYANWSILFLFWMVMDFESSYWVVISFFQVLMLLSLILIHEYGHILSARKYGVSCEGINLSFFGGVASIDSTMNELSPQKQMVIVLCGPLTNLVFALSTFFIDVDWLMIINGMVSHTATGGELLLGYFALLNWTMLIFNLFPIYPMDGGRLLKSGLEWAGVKKYEEISKWVSYIVGALVIGLFVWLGMWSGALVVLFLILLSIYESRENGKL